MGTEGRRDGVKEIAATDTITGVVKFRVDLIKDIKIIKEASSEVLDDEEDPAIVASKETVKESPKEAKPETPKKEAETQPEKARRQLEKFSLEDGEGDSKVDGEFGVNRF